MKLVRFDAPAHHQLIAFGQTIGGGQTVEMPDDEAASLAADPHIDVTVSEPSERKHSKPKAAPSGAAEPEAHGGEGQPNNKDEGADQ